MGGFNNPILGAGGALVYPSIHSPNFNAGPPIVGWSLDKNGDASLSGTLFVQGALIFNGYNGQFSPSSIAALGAGPGASLELDSGLGTGSDTDAVVTLFSQQANGRGVLVGDGNTFRQMATALEVDNTIGLQNRGSDPPTPTGGGVLYCKGGALYFRGTSGTVTQIASA